MIKFMIPVPGKFQPSEYGVSHYCIDKKGNLAICGIKAPAYITRRYSFEFTSELAQQYGLYELPREIGGSDERD